MDLSTQSILLQSNKCLQYPLKTQTNLQLSCVTKKYLVKRQKYINQRSKQAKNFFKLSHPELQQKISTNQSQIYSINNSIVIKQNKQNKEIQQYKQNKNDILNNNSIAISKYLSMNPSKYTSGRINSQQNQIIQKNQYQTINYEHKNQQKYEKSKHSNSKQSLFQSQINKNTFMSNNQSLKSINNQNNLSSILQSNNNIFNSNRNNKLGNKNKKYMKKYVFETICDKNFNKSLKRSEILIQLQPQQQQKYKSYMNINNPQTQSIQKIQNIEQNKYRSINLPKILSTIHKGSKTQKNQKTKNNKLQISLNKQQSFNNYEKQQISKYESLNIHQNQPLYKIRSELSYQFNRQKLNKYQQMWQKQSQNRLFLSINNKKHKNQLLQKSLLQNSLQKSMKIAKNYNKNIQMRKSLQKFEDQLRNYPISYATIGQINIKLEGLKGKELIICINQ